MKAASALIRSAETLGVVLWVEGGQIRYKARQPVSDGFKSQIKARKAEIIELLREKPVEEGKSSPPEYCDSKCKCFHRLVVPDLGTLAWCCWEEDSAHWRRVRIDAMTECPMTAGNAQDWPGRKQLHDR